MIVLSSIPNIVRTALCVTILASSVGSAFADEDSKQKKLYELAEILEFYNTPDLDHEWTRKELDDKMREWVEVQRKENQNSSITEEIKRDMDKIYEAMLPRPLSEEQKKERRADSERQWKELKDQGVKSWARHYGEMMTEEDLDTVLAYYKSPVGKKDLAAQRRVNDIFREGVLGSLDDVCSMLKERLARDPSVRKQTWAAGCKF
jgi:hypothetical protein